MSPGELGTEPKRGHAESGGTRTASENGAHSGYTGSVPSIPGGPANLAVLGGNLPPSFGTSQVEPNVRRRHSQSAGLVARRNGPVARSPRTQLLR